MVRSIKNLSVLISKPQTIKTGIVQKALRGGRWQIAIGTALIAAFSSIDLFHGQRVVIGQTNEGWAVIDAGAFSTFKVTRIKIDG